MAPLACVPLFTSVLTGGLGRYAVEAYAKGDNQRVTQIVSSIFPLLLVASVLTVLVGGLAAWQVGRILVIAAPLVGKAQIMFALLALMAAANLALSPFGLGFYVRQKFVLLNVINLGVQVLRACMLFALLFGIGTSVLWVVVAGVTSEMVGLIIRTWTSRRLLPALNFRVSEMSRATARQVLTFGTWTFVQNLAETIRNSADPIILNHLGTPLDVTCLHLGSMAHRELRRVIGLVLSPLLPPLTALHAKGDNAGLRYLYLRGGRVTLWAVLLPATFLVIYRQELMELYVGAKFSAAAAVMAILLCTFPIGIGHCMRWAIAYATGDIRRLALIVLFNQLVNLSLTFYLVGVAKMGAMGAALATFLVAAILGPLLLWNIGFRMIDVTLREWLARTAIPGLLPAAGGAAAWLAIRAVTEPESWLQLAASGLAGAAVYAAVLGAFCLQPVDRNDLRHVWNRLRTTLGRRADR